MTECVYDPHRMTELKMWLNIGWLDKECDCSHQRWVIVRSAKICCRCILGWCQFEASLSGFHAVFSVQGTVYTTHYTFLSCWEEGLRVKSGTLASNSGNKIQWRRIFADLKIPHIKLSTLSKTLKYVNTQTFTNVKWFIFNLEKIAIHLLSDMEIEIIYH
jgi:hypothetical protein